MSNCFLKKLLEEKNLEKGKRLRLSQRHHIATRTGVTNLIQDHFNQSVISRIKLFKFVARNRTSCTGRKELYCKHRFETEFLSIFFLVFKSAKVFSC